MAELSDKPYNAKEAVQEYIDGVTSGKIIAGRMVQFAVRRHLQDLKTGHERGWKFSERHAVEACEFFPTFLRLTKGEWAGTPFVPFPFYAFALWNIYGWRNIKSGYRRYTLAYISTGRGSAKSEVAAGIGVKHLVADDPLDPAAQGFVVSTKHEQARDYTWKQARQMIETSELLKDRVNCFQHALVVPIGQPQPYSSFKPLGSNSKTTGDSFDLSFAIFDELHAWQHRHQELFDKLTSARKSRPQPLILITTTAGDDHSPIWQTKDRLYTNILESAVVNNVHVGDHVFVLIARLDEQRDCDCAGRNKDCPHCGGSGIVPADDIFDERCWPKANPNFPVTPTLRYLREQAAEAKMDRTAENGFKRFNCNLKASSREKPIPAAVWAKAAGTLSDWGTAAVVAGAVDLGWRDDLASLGFCAKFRRDNVSDKLTDRDGKPMSWRYEVRSASWLPVSGNRDVSKEPWLGWIRAGLLKTCDADTVAIEDVQQAAVKLGKQYKVKAYRGDRHNALQLMQALEVAGFDAVEQPQTCAVYNEPLREFLRLLKWGLITYDSATEPILTWAANNMIVRRNARGEWMPDKEKSADKIDPMVAVIMAFAEAMYAKPAPTSKPYSGTGTGVWV